jgi:hypothetical protein
LLAVIFLGQRPSEVDMPKHLDVVWRLHWLRALFLALTAAFIFRNGYEEIAAIIWLLSLILALPMWSQRG